MTDLHTVARWLSEADTVVTFSGAGLSKASGIPTYRNAGGLWTTGGNLKFSSIESLAADPEGFRAFWARRRDDIARAEPNAGHRALRELGMVDETAARGGRIVVVNVEASELDARAHAVLRGPAEEVLPALVAALA